MIGIQPSGEQKHFINQCSLVASLQPPCLPLSLSHKHTHMNTQETRRLTTKQHILQLSEIAGSPKALNQKDKRSLKCGKAQKLWKGFDSSAEIMLRVIRTKVPKCRISYKDRTLCCANSFVMERVKGAFTRAVYSALIRLWSVCLETPVRLWKCECVIKSKANSGPPTNLG